MPEIDTLSLGGARRPWPNHEWLAQVILYGLSRLGGLPLVTPGAGLVATVGVLSALWLARVRFTTWLPLRRAGPRCTRTRVGG